MKLKETKLRHLILLILLALPNSAIPSSTVEFIGSFHYQRVTEEHIYNYRLDLWREGDKVFGFYGSYGGLQGNGEPDIEPWRVDGTVKGRSLSLKNDHIGFHFSGNLLKNEISGRWRDSGETADLFLNLPSTETAPALLKAPRESYEVWSRWAEQYLDTYDEKNWHLSQDVNNCEAGDGRACLAAGNHSNLRGNKERALQRYESGCRLNNANCCINVGQVDKAKEILKKQCTGKSTMENNFACEKLGKLAEKSGNLTKAKEWYRKGCNDSIPKVCPDFRRLENN